MLFVQKAKKPRREAATTKAKAKLQEDPEARALQRLAIERNLLQTQAQAEKEEYASPPFLDGIEGVSLEAKGMARGKRKLLVQLPGR